MAMADAMLPLHVVAQLLRRGGCDADAAALRYAAARAEEFLTRLVDDAVERTQKPGPKSETDRKQPKKRYRSMESHIYIYMYNNDNK